MENISNHTNCENDGLARVVTAALRTALAAAATRLYSGRLSAPQASFYPQHKMYIL